MVAFCSRFAEQGTPQATISGLMLAGVENTGGAVLEQLPTVHSTGDAELEEITDGHVAQAWQRLPDLLAVFNDPAR